MTLKQIVPLNCESQQAQILKCKVAVVIVLVIGLSVLQKQIYSLIMQKLQTMYQLEEQLFKLNYLYLPANSITHN